MLAESFDQENKRFKGAAVTAVVSWAELVSVIPIGDQANTLCLFATTPTDDARQQLLATLRDDDTPSLRSILHSEGSALAVITQEDEGLGRSSILIAGNSGLGDLIDAASDELNERVGTYLVETAAASTRNEWAAATERLTAGFIEAS